MRTRTFLCVGACLAALLFTAASEGQPPADSGFPITIPSVAPPQPQPQNIDQLIKSLADIRAKKAELDKQEQAVVKSLKEKLKEQRDVLKKMGVEVDEP